MSIQVRQRKKGKVYIVRVYDPTTLSKYLVRTFDRETDARAFEAQHTLAKRRGDLEALDAGRETLEEFEQEWWENYAQRHLAATTQKTYRFLLDKYILPDLKRHQLRKLNPRLISTWAAGISAGSATQRKALAILQGILERAVEWDRIPTNPVKAVKKPANRTVRQSVRALAPREIERIAAGLDHRSRTLVYVLGYAGLRPGEALALRWRDIGARSITVDKALALGEEKPTKTGASRVVPLLGPLKADLAAYRLRSGNPGDDTLVFPMRDGSPWTATTYRNWRRRRFRRAAGEGVRPYDLRHSFASLCFAERRNPREIADLLGHSLQTLLSTYVHIIEELKDAERVDAEALIRESRLRPSGAAQARAGTG
jgi:integrase